MNERGKLKEYEDVPGMTQEQIDRYARAALKLNSFEWDELAGEKPKNFDNLPNYYHKSDFQYFLEWFLNVKDKRSTKSMFVRKPREEIEEKVGEKNVSWAHFKYNLGKSREEWEEFWDSPEHQDFLEWKKELIAGSENTFNANLARILVWVTILSILSLVPNVLRLFEVLK
jgi:hypothetical protein